MVGFIGGGRMAQAIARGFIGRVSRPVLAKTYVSKIFGASINETMSRPHTHGGGVLGAELRQTLTHAYLPQHAQVTWTDNLSSAAAVRPNDHL
ncbi:hypothetical protein BaRGS_00038696 [Batillaria attramentaria]|uniref:Pyrroline-5-carboxylate reductase n=1 Tax=Batillaria attramentaria TaxID=370345 RepID=A0ABD0J5E4_9CAEN